MLPITNIAEFEAWTDNTQLILAPLAAVPSFTNFALPEGLSRFGSVQFDNITVDFYLRVLESIEEELVDADFTALAPQVEIFKLQLAPFTSEFTLLEELLANDFSGLEAGIAEVRSILSGSTGTDTMEAALESVAFSGPSTATEESDDLTGDGGDNVIDLLGGNDAYDGRGGNDTIDGGDGLDILVGGAGNDRINGGADFDRILGGKGNDILNGDGGDDRVIGDAGKDKISGGAGDDDLRGLGGRDNIKGGAGNDKITAGNGNDRVDGGKGRDDIEGGAGNDTLKGGAGNDTFVFNKNNGTDVIKDFRNNKDTLEINLDGALPTDALQWLRENAEVVGGEVVITTLGGSVTLEGIGKIRLLADDIDFV